MKKLDMVLGGIELFIGAGVTIIVGSALTLVKPTNLGAFKKLAVSMGAFAISMVVADKVVEHVDGVFNETATQFKNIFKKDIPEEIEEEEA